MYKFSLSFSYGARTIALHWIFFKGRDPKWADGFSPGNRLCSFQKEIIVILKPSTGFGWILLKMNIINDAFALPYSSIFFLLTTNQTDVDGRNVFHTKHLKQGDFLPFPIGMEYIAHKDNYQRVFYHQSFYKSRTVCTLTHTLRKVNLAPCSRLTTRLGTGAEGCLFLTGTPRRRGTPVFPRPYSRKVSKCYKVK